MSAHTSMKQIRRWVSALMWLRHNGSRWETNGAGGLYTVAFDQEEEQKWLDCLPVEHRDAVRSMADQETNRLKTLVKRTGRGYAYLLIHNRPVL